MLTTDEIRPYLLHKDAHLRKTAVTHFRDSWSRDTTLVPAILQACDLYGAEENVTGLAAAYRFPLTEYSFRDVLERLARAADLRTTHTLNRVVVAAPVEFLLRYENEILENAGMIEESIELCDRRRELAGWTGARLWEELQDLARRSAEKQHVGEIDHAYADALVDALSAHQIPEDVRLCESLSEVKEDPGWLPIFLIDLAGAKRLSAAVPTLVEVYRIDADYTMERCSDALARIGDPEAAGLIRGAFAKESWD
ncbi:MAG: hypothetical protein GY778_27155 [bacterium]|nr:hypothetical protein [bacterium]